MLFALGSDGPRALLALRKGAWTAAALGPCAGSTRSTQKRHGLSAREANLVGAWRCGSTVEPADIGSKLMKKAVRDELAQRGLGYCHFLRRVLALQDMQMRCASFEGRQRYNLFHLARTRARNKDLPFDTAFMKTVAFGPLPTHFAGVVYHVPRGHQGPRGPSKMSLTIDRIVGSKGYVQGNVRFLPMWLNLSLQAFSDGKARLIAERFAGVRPTLAAELVSANHYRCIRQMVANVRSRAMRYGVPLGSCFMFEHLLHNKKFISRCPFSGIPLHYGIKRSGGQYNSPSFDRIDAVEGYTCANVHVVSMSANALKNDMRLGEMEKLLDAIKYLSTATFQSTHIPGYLSSICAMALLTRSRY